VQKNAGATVRKAFLFAASTGGTGYEPVDGDVTLDGSPVAWNPADTMSNSIGSVNVAADVTALVKAKVDAALAGPVDFIVAEPFDTYLIDGEILAVILDDPTVRRSSGVTLLYGAQSTGGDTFRAALAQPVNKADPSFALDLSLGISYGYQPAGQYTTIDVNGSRLTSSAGGQDDGEGANGALITVGGIGDLTDNPPDPYATDFTCSGLFGGAPRCDDELYSLLPFVANGDTSLSFATANPSNDDNIFFAALNARSSAAVVLPGIVLAPVAGKDSIGQMHTMTATVADSSGHAVQGLDVHFAVTAGPNFGATGVGTTNATGKATFAYTSSDPGTDRITATVTADGTGYTSNEVTETWTLKSGWAPEGNIYNPRDQERADAAHIHDAGECAPNSVLLFRVRGSGEQPGSDFLGAWTASAGNALITGGWRVRDLQADYPAPALPLPQIAIALISRNPFAVLGALASLKSYRDAVTRTWPSVRDMLVNAYNRCPQRTIAVSGYSLGGIVLRYVIPNLPARVRAKIARIDLIADPTEQGSVDAAIVHQGPFSARRTDEGIDTWAARKPNLFFRQTPYPPDVARLAYQYCVPYDVVCETNPINLSLIPLGESGRHRSYDVAGIGRAAGASVNARRSW
jgi:hypothetical protein